MSPGDELHHLSLLFFLFGWNGEAELAADLGVDFFHLFYLLLELQTSLLLGLELFFQFAYVCL